MSTTKILRERLGVIVQLRALLVQLGDETLDMQVNAAALLADGSQAQQTRNAPASAERALATMRVVHDLLAEYRQMMIDECQSDGDGEKP